MWCTFDVYSNHTWCHDVARPILINYHSQVTWIPEYAIVMTLIICQTSMNKLKTLCNWAQCCIIGQLQSIPIPYLRKCSQTYFDHSLSNSIWVNLKVTLFCQCCFMPYPIDKAYWSQCTKSILTMPYHGNRRHHLRNLHKSVALGPWNWIQTLKKSMPNGQQKHCQTHLCLGQPWWKTHQVICLNKASHDIITSFITESSHWWSLPSGIHPYVVWKWHSCIAWRDSNLACSLCHYIREHPCSHKADPPRRMPSIRGPLAALIEWAFPCVATISQVAPLHSCIDRA